MLVNECPTDEPHPLQFAWDRKLPFCQQIVQWGRDSATSVLEGTRGNRRCWVFRVPQYDICYDIRITGKLDCAYLGCGDREPFVQQAFDSNLAECTETIKFCFAPIRFGLLHPTLTVIASECPIVESTCVVIADSDVRRAEVRPVIQGYSCVPDSWDPDNQCLKPMDRLFIENSPLFTKGA